MFGRLWRGFRIVTRRAQKRLSELWREMFLALRIQIKRCFHFFDWRRVILALVMRDPRSPTHSGAT
jgi:hypothetical protein